MLFLGITAIQDAVRGEPHYIPLVVSLSNHERLFDRLRANGLVLFSEQWLEPISIAVRCLFVMTVSSSVTRVGVMLRLSHLTLRVMLR